MLTRLITLITSWALVTFYFFQAIKTVFPEPTIWWLYWTFECILFAFVLYIVLTVKRSVNTSGAVFGIFTLMLISFIPKLIAIPLLLVEDIIRIISFTVRSITHSGTSQHAVIYLASRNLIISKLSLTIALIPFASLIWGILNGKYNYRVHQVSIKFADLPNQFNGFTITQLSDIHSGSLIDKMAVEKGINLANAQHSDLLLFTGDLVNNSAGEMDKWKASFSRLEAPYGKYSVLGNHDYGDYIQWETEQAKATNLDQVKAVNAEIGFRLLLNEHVQIKKNGQHLILIGVENWGKGRFAKHGDLAKATENIEAGEFIILMSHDPSHWEAEILKFPKHIHLTLAGHTHGMQFGIELPFFKWSPIKYVYPQWAGLYEEAGKFINVNRGFGFLGYPGRFGILPEITVITLLKA